MNVELLMLLALFLFGLFTVFLTFQELRNRRKQAIDAKRREELKSENKTDNSDTPKESPTLSRPNTEYYELRKLNPYPQCGEYIRFTNLVIESGYKTPYTEIDELIVSRFGIFCIEQKDVHGIILGKKRDRTWTQCLRNYRGDMVNPCHQNYKHRRALEKLLYGKLHAPIYTYSYFPKAYKVVTDDRMLFRNLDDLWREIRSHTAPVYTFDELKEITKMVATESTHKANRTIIHVATLKYYLSHQ